MLRQKTIKQPLLIRQLRHTPIISTRSGDGHMLYELTKPPQWRFFIASPLMACYGQLVLGNILAITKQQ